MATVDPDKLDKLVEKFLDKFIEAFGIEWMTPKFHWMLHFGDHLRKHSWLLNCFVLERKHRVAKRYATEMKNKGKTANSSLIMEITSHHLAAIDAAALWQSMGPTQRATATRTANFPISEWCRGS